jgi:transposase
VLSVLLGHTPRRVLAYRRPVDMRKSIDGLVGLVQNVLREDPLSGSLFVFFNRRGNYLKLVAWDRTGFCLFAKRLERGRFVLPGESEKLELPARAFELLLDGILLGVRRLHDVERLHVPAGREGRLASP